MSGTDLPRSLRCARWMPPFSAIRDVLIRVEAGSVNRSDWEGLIERPLYARMRGLFRPHRIILGSDIAGRVALRGRGTFARLGGTDALAGTGVWSAACGRLLFSCHHENRLGAGPVCGWGIGPPRFG